MVVVVVVVMCLFLLSDAFLLIYVCMFRLVVSFVIRRYTLVVLEKNYSDHWEVL